MIRAVPTLEQRLDAALGAAWRNLPRVVRAPGRVNLIGDHTDYNGGFVLPAAIQLECVVAASPADNNRLRTLDDVDPGWTRYVDAVASELGGALEGTVASSVPPGAGLASSAALEVACAVAIAPEQPSRELALACRRAEHAATGVPSGVMDQLASICGCAGRALLIDCRSLEITPVALPEDLALVVVHSGVHRRLEGSAYGDRRAECGADAHALGLTSLRDATPTDVRGRPRARHVVTENARVLAAVDALADGDLERLGALFDESHASLRDDFEVSTPELDVLADELVRGGALGARLTGAGFGGCVVAVATRDRIDDVLAAAGDRYAFVAEASEGAGEWSPT